ncbi:AAA family ATPase [Stenotrophomonas hibiscicola]
MAAKNSKRVLDEQFEYVLDVCRAAVQTGEEIPKHQVRRLLDYFNQSGDVDQARDLQKLFDNAAKGVSGAPRRLVRSRANLQGEVLGKAVRPPLDKETSAPLADIIWPDDLPTSGPVLTKELQLLADNFVKEWHLSDALLEVGVLPTRSALIYGEPGTGKTHLALWISQQLGMPVVLARLDGMISSFLGTTSRNIGNLFDFAERYQCVLLLDEFDAVAKLRDDPHEMGEIKRVVNTILQRLDLRREVGVTIGITNHEQLLDPAVWRRFQIQIRMPKPSLEGRAAILKRYLPPFVLPAPEERFLAWLTTEMSGADIQSFVDSYKRLKVVIDRDLTLVELCRIAADMHNDRISQEQKRILSLTDAQVARALAAAPDADGDIQSLSVIFGKSRSTIKRWLDG